MIVGQNSLLNQYVPTFFIKDLLDGQTLRYDSTRRAFVNATGGGGSGATRLGELDDVSPSVDNPLSLQNGQSLVYNSFTSLWENKFILPDQTGNAGKFLTTNGSVLSWIAVAGAGTVTSVAGTGTQGVTVSGSPITAAGTLTIGLGAITPTSVASTGPVTGSNLSGINTGNQTIALTGDVTGSGTGSFPATLSNTGVVAATYGSATQVPVFTVDSKGRITGVTNTTIPTGGSVTSVSGTGTVSGLTLSGTVTTSGNLTLGGSLSLTSGQITTGLGYTPYNATNPAGYTTNTGTVTSVTGAGGTTGMTLAGGPITAAGTLTLGGTLVIANGGTGATTAAGARNALLPTQPGNAGRFLTTDGANVSWATISGTGTVTSVAATGSVDISVGGSPITTSGTLTFALTNTTVTPATYGSATQVPVFAVDAKGRITGVTNTTITGSGSAIAEQVVFHYGPGGSGNFTPVDAKFSETAGVTATITDPANCIVQYTFTGKSNPPKSITTYGQNFTTNVFNIKDTTSLPSPSITGGGTAASPDLANGIFSASNVVTLQTRMSDVGASSTIGNRAWCIVVFGF